jgi:hypothetical protein
LGRICDNSAEEPFFSLSLFSDVVKTLNVTKRGLRLRASLPLNQSDHVSFGIGEKGKNSVARFERALKYLLAVVLNPLYDLINIFNFNVQCPMSRKYTFSGEYAAVYTFGISTLERMKSRVANFRFPIKDFLIELGK